MLAMSTVRRLSMPTTSYPRSSRASDRWDPMKPEAPVITTRVFMAWEGTALVGVFVEEPLDERQPHDLEVEANRPVFDVVQVVFDSLFERRVATPAIDLRP